MEKVPVLICGGGLVGLSTAVLLARHGVQPLLVERHPGTSPLPKGRGVNLRSMEVFRSAGVEEALRAAPLSILSRYTDIVRAERLAGEEQFRATRPATGALSGLSPTVPLMVDQNEVEPVLRAHAGELGAQLRFDTELVSFAQDGDRVRARLRDRRTGRETEVEARYLVAADGHESPIRKRLGIGADRIGQTQHFVNIPFQADLSVPLAGRPIALAYLRRPVPDTMLTRLDRHDRWVLMVPFDQATTDLEKTFDDEGRTAAIRAAIGDENLEFSLISLYPGESSHVQTWELASWVAQRYRVGNVLLAGDAAHVMAPAGGLAGNTGVQDAHNLAWKLALVLAGIAGDGLLDTYETERRPVALVTRDYCAARQQSRNTRAGERALAVDPISLSLGYHQYSPAVIGSGEPTAITKAAELSGQPGTRVPHAILNRNGAELSTVDLADRGFHLLAGPEGGKWALAARAAAETRGLPLEASLLGDDLTDPRGTAAMTLRLRADEAILLRPDGFVCWRSTVDSDPVTTLDAVLDTVLAR